MVNTKIGKKKKKELAVLDTSGMEQAKNQENWVKGDWKAVKVLVPLSHPHAAGALSHQAEGWRFSLEGVKQRVSGLGTPGTAENKVPGEEQGH